LEIAGMWGSGNVNLNLKGCLLACQAVVPVMREQGDFRNQLVPLRRKMGTAWDVAYASLFLHSPPGFITGVVLPVDDGQVPPASANANFRAANSTPIIRTQPANTEQPDRVTCILIGADLALRAVYSPR
jgi:hypothetical protein